MAILKHNGNEVEVRIRNVKDNTYYNEYVSIDSRPADNRVSCEHYIIPKADTTYAIDVNLKEGYIFGNCKKVYARLYFSNNLLQSATGSVTVPKGDEHCTKTRLDINLEHSNEYVNPTTIRERGALSFKSLLIGE